MKRTSLSLAVMLTLAACSNGTDDTADDKTSAQGGEKPTTVRVLTHDSFVLSDEHIAQFEEETGYTLETIAPGDGGLVVNQLILNKDNPSADAVFGLDNFLVPTAIDEGVLAEASTEAVPDSATDLVVEGRAIPIDRGDVCINADLTWFEEEGMELPSSLEDLAKPEYAELLVVTDPVTSSPGFAFLTGTISVFGDEWTDYWSDLVAGGTRVADGWSDAYYSDFSGSDGEGPFPLVLSYSPPRPPRWTIRGRRARRSSRTRASARSSTRRSLRAGRTRKVPRRSSTSCSPRKCRLPCRRRCTCIRSTTRLSFRKRGLPTPSCRITRSRLTRPRWRR